MAINMKLVKAVLDRIENDPEHWNQGYFRREGDCGTTYCFGGFAIALSGGYDEDGTYRFLVTESVLAAKYLGMLDENEPTEISELAYDIFFDYPEDWRDDGPQAFREWVMTKIAKYA